MKIDKIVVSRDRTNCYILTIDDNCLVIDPGDNYDLIKEKIESLNVLGILITHRHPDHIGALKKMLADYPVMVYDKKSGEDHYNIGPFKFDIIENSGHAWDCVSFYFTKEKALFSGDFLFKETIGRTDFPTGNDEEMLKSLRKIKNYPPDTDLYPGHGHFSTLEHEFKYNRYLKNLL